MTYLICTFWAYRSLDSTRLQYSGEIKREFRNISLTACYCIACQDYHYSSATACCNGSSYQRHLCKNFMREFQPKAFSKTHECHVIESTWSLRLYYHMAHLCNDVSQDWRTADSSALMHNITGRTDWVARAPHVSKHQGFENRNRDTRPFTSSALHMQGAVDHLSLFIEYGVIDLRLSQRDMA